MWASNDDVMKTPSNIVPYSTTWLVCADYAHAEANISKGVTSGSSSPSSFLNISYDSQQRFKLVAMFGFYVSQTTLYPTSIGKQPISCLQSVAKFPSADCFPYG
jgi:hypothetical protein